MSKWKEDKTHGDHKRCKGCEHHPDLASTPVFLGYCTNDISLEGWPAAQPPNCISLDVLKRSYVKTTHATLSIFALGLAGYIGSRAGRTLTANDLHVRLSCGLCLLIDMLLRKGHNITRHGHRIRWDLRQVCSY